MSETIGLFEAVYTQRALRRLKPDPVPDELLWKILEAGTKAPSGGNTQVWRFIVIRDPARKRFIQERYKQAWDEYVNASAAAAAAAPRTAPPSEAEMRAQVRMFSSGVHLAEHLHEAPVLLLVCMVPRPLPAVHHLRQPAALYASIFPAVQNVLLAARSLGLGATLTTLHLMYEDEIKAELGIPNDTETVALIPLGYPEGRYGPTKRQPVEEVTYWESWGARRARSVS